VERFISENYFFKDFWNIISLINNISRISLK